MNLTDFHHRVLQQVDYAGQSNVRSSRSTKGIVDASTPSVYRDYSLPIEESRAKARSAERARYAKTSSALKTLQRRGLVSSIGTGHGRTWWLTEAGRDLRWARVGVRLEAMREHFAHGCKDLEPEEAAELTAEAFDTDARHVLVLFFSRPNAEPKI